MLTLIDLIRIIITLIGVLSVCILAIVLAFSIADAKPLVQCRSSISGKIVPTMYARAHPDTTYCAARKRKP